MRFPFRRVFEDFPIASYILATLGWSWGVWIFLMLSSLDSNQRIWKCFYVAGLSGPLVASLLVTFASGGLSGVRALLKQCSIWQVAPRWYAAALGLPPFLMMAAWGLGAMGVAWRPPSWELLLATLLWVAVRGGPVNEELGWRGFLLPRLLARHNPFWASLILLPMWTVWHWPLWFLDGIPHKYWPFPIFVLILIPMTFLFTWLHLNTRGSVLLAVVFHTSINTAIKFIPILPPQYSGLSPFLAWIGFAWLLALVVIYRNKAVWFARAKARAPVLRPVCV